MNYSALTWRYFLRAGGGAADDHAGTISSEDACRGRAGHIDHGAWVQFDLRVAGGIIVQARYRAFACPHTIAVCAWLAERALGSPPEVSLPEDLRSVEQRFDIPLNKRGRLLIVADAWRAAAGAAQAAGEAAAHAATQAAAAAAAAPLDGDPAA